MNFHIFNFNRSNRLSISDVVADDDYGRVVSLWLSGRIFGRYVSLSIPWEGRR